MLRNRTDFTGPVYIDGVQVMGGGGSMGQVVDAGSVGGIVADGVTDNASAMLDLLSDAPPGSTVLFQPGTVIIGSSVTINRSNIRLASSGITIFKTSPIFANNPSNGYILGFLGVDENNRVSNIEIDGIYFDSDWGNGTNALTDGTLPDQTGMTTTQIKLPATASAVDDFYNGGGIMLFSGAGAGYESTISDYVGATRILTVATAHANVPNATSVFGILLSGVQSNFGLGRLRFAYAQNIVLNRTGGTGGHGKLDFAVVDDVRASNLYAKNVGENVYNILSSSGKRSYRHTINNFIFKNVGEGFDWGYSQGCTCSNGIMTGMAGTPNSAFDINGVSHSEFSNIYCEGFRNAISLHGSVPSTDPVVIEQGASYHLTFTNVRGRQFEVSGVEFLFGAFDQPGQAAQDGTICHNIKFLNCSMVSTIASTIGFHIGSANTAKPVRVRNISLVNCSAEVPGAALRMDMANIVQVNGGTYESSGSYAIQLAPNITYYPSEVDIANTSVRAVTTNTQGAIHAIAGNGVRIQRNTVLGNTVGRAMSLTNVKGLRVRDNEVRGCAVAGLHVEWTVLALTDTGWTGVANTNMLTPDNNINALIEGNQIKDWGSAAASTAAVRAYVNINSAIDVRGLIVKDNIARLDAVTNNSHQGIRVEHHASITGLGCIVSGNDVDRNVGTRLYTQTLNMILGETFIERNMVNSPTAGYGYDKVAYITFFANDVAASQTNVPLVCSSVGGTYAAGTRWIAPRSGLITAVQVISNAARTNGTAACEVRRGGVATGLIGTLDATNTLRNAAYQNAGSSTVGGPDLFNAGDYIEIYLTTDATWAPVTADFQVIVEVRM